MKMIVLCAVCVSSMVLLAQTQNKARETAPAPLKNVKPALIPLNAKTGLWQITKTLNWTLPPQLPPQYAQYAAILQKQNGIPDRYKSCVRPKDLSSNPWSEGAGQKCTWTVLTSTGTDMEIQGSCDLSQEWDMPATAEGHGKIHMVDFENGTGSEDFTLTANGMTANGHAAYTGKWIAATCPAGTD